MEITLTGMLLGLLPMVVGLYLIYAAGARVVRRLTVAVFGMVVQLALTGLLSWGLWSADSAWMGMAALLVLTLLSAWQVVHRGRLRRRLMWPVVWESLFVSVSLLSVYVSALVLRVPQVLSARWLLPLGGVLLAVVQEPLSAMLREHFVGLVRYSSVYYYHVGNGAPWYRAMLPVVRQSLRRALLPVSRRWSALGLLVPSLLWGGLLLGGAGPWEAVALVVVVASAGLLCLLTSFVLVLLLSRRMLTDQRGRLKDAVRLKPRTPVSSTAPLDEGQ